MNKIARQIVVNSNPFETRIAKVEDSKLVEFYVERVKDRGLTGNVYKGTVVRVLPGMQAAFVEVGLQRTAFLHVSDISDPFAGLDVDDKEDSGKGPGRIQDKLKEGQKVIVQVAKEPIGTKGARVTS